MPLIFPIDLRAEGLGYALTTMSFYILPNLLNLGLLCGVMYYQVSRLSGRALPLESKPLWLLAGGAAVVGYHFDVIWRDCCGFLL